MKNPFSHNKKERLPETLKKGLLPDEKFLKQGKAHFMAAYDTSELSKNPIRKFNFVYGIKFAIGVFAVLLIAIAGTSAYADTANVSVSSPLYPLKRVAENVQLALTPAPQKAQVQATFAVRRADEIKDLQEVHPSSTLIPGLTSDLDADVSSSLASASSSDLKAQHLGSLCATLGVRIGADILSHQNLLARFNAQCDKKNERGSDLMATTTATSTDDNSDDGHDGDHIRGKLHSVLPF